MAGCGEMPAAGGGAFAGTFELSGGSAVDDGSRSLRALLSEDPAGAGRGPARGLAALYRRLLLDARDGDVPGRLLEAATARRMGETVHPSTFDVVQGLELDVGRAMYARPNFGGPYASPASFGHGGSRSSFGFGDPAVGLAVGDAVGLVVGGALGDAVGLAVGDALGLVVGDAVGDGVVVMVVVLFSRWW